MTPSETAAKLRQYNQWRRGNLEGMPQPDPREIGEAIDAAVEMIDHLDALRAELKAAHAMALIGVEWRELAEAREAELERMRRQEPIGWFARLDGDGLLMECKHADISRVPLYALPGAQAQPAPSVPDGWKLVPIEPTQEMLDAGEDTFVSSLSGTPTSSPIAVYRAMLAAAPEAKL